MNWALVVLSLLAGLVSALLPFVNAEALAAGASKASRDHLPVVVVALATGQTIGKLVLFEVASRGAKRLAARTTKRSARLHAISRIATRQVAGLQAASSRLPVVAISALTGLPPLAAVAVAAGTTQVNRTGFVAACFVGRTLRFALIAYGLTFVLAR